MAAIGRAAASPLLVLLFCIYMIIVGIAGWAINRIFDGNDVAVSVNYTFLLTALIAGVVGLASVMAGLHHLHAWRAESGAAAGSSALIAWLLTLLAFGLACKEIHSSYKGTKLKTQRTLESFVIIAAFFQLLYLILLHAGLLSSRLGPGYSGDRAPTSYGVGEKHQPTGV